MDNNTKHTPAPWHLRDASVPLGEEIIVDCGDPAQPHTVGAVAAILNFARFMSFTEGARRCDERMRANAHLIAAAPDLLAACKLALGAFENNNAIDWGELEAAINKAEADHA